VYLGNVIYPSKDDSLYSPFHSPFLKDIRMLQDAL
jgi:hypothetical protein